MSWPTRRWRAHRTAMFASMAAVATLTLVGVLIWPITDLIAAHDVGVVAGSQRALHLQAAREAVRSQLLTLAAGLFVAGTLWFTAQNYRLSRHQQVTDRYTKAIEQLGSDKLDVRIGAVYALERIARDSATDHPTVMEVLAAFTREHSREPWPPDAAGSRDISSGRRTRPDLEAAMTVIGRRDIRRDRTPIDISRADLIWVYLPDANLTKLDLYRVDLTRAILRGADLAGARLRRAILTDADLTSADLTGADLEGADLTGADLTGARLANHAHPPAGWTRDPGSGLLIRGG